MANKRTLKKNISLICTDLLADCVAMSLYGPAKDNGETINALLHTVARLEDDYLRRVSHPEPGMAAKDYYKHITAQFAKDVTEIADQINSMN